MDLPAGFALYVPPVPTVTVVPCGPPAGYVKRHVVQAGDNLYRIALSYGITYQQLQRANCMGSSTTIYRGQVLWVPKFHVAHAYTGARRNHHPYIPFQQIPTFIHTATNHTIAYEKTVTHNAPSVSMLLVGCGTLAPPPPQAALPFILVTSAPNASPTPTPFQPIPWTPTGTLQSQPLTDSATGTATPSALTQTQLPTIDPNMLINTVAPLATIEASGSQVLNNGQETVNFLLIGSDGRPGSSFRTDTMVIAILRPNEGQVSLISIPRDLWVYIPEWENQRINTAYQHGISVGYPGGGPGLLKDTILYNLGIRIDHTARVEFDGFRQIVDTLGGVDVPVSCAYTDWKLIDPSYDPQNENNWFLYTTGPGLVHMDGDLALWYARSRQKSSDFDRGRRQQEVLRALFVQALQAGHSPVSLSFITT